MPEKKQFEERRVGLHWFTMCGDPLRHAKESMVAAASVGKQGAMDGPTCGMVLPTFSECLPVSKNSI